MIIKCTKIIYISYFVSPLIAKRAEDYDNEMRAVRPRKLTFNNWKGFLNSISDSCVVGPVNVPECACQSRSFFEMQSVEGENSRWQMKIQRWKFQSNEGTKKGCLACTVANGGAAAALAAQAAIVKKLNIKSFFQAQFATDAVHPLAPCTLSLASCFNWIEGAPRDPPADANQFPRIFFLALLLCAIIFTCNMAINAHPAHYLVPLYCYPMRFDFPLRQYPLSFVLLCCMHRLANTLEKVKRGSKERGSPAKVSGTQCIRSWLVPFDPLRISNYAMAAKEIRWISLFFVDRNEFFLWFFYGTMKVLLIEKSDHTTGTWLIAWWLKGY